MDGPFLCRRRRFLGVSFAILMLTFPIANAQNSVVSNSCSEDGFCTLISVQHEIVVRSPRPVVGAVVGVIDDDGFQPSTTNDQTEKKVCRKEVRVPEVVHRAVVKMFESVSLRGGADALPAQLTSAEQTMLLYYNTIMQQTMNSSCEK